MERKLKALILTLWVVVVFINAARVIVGYEDSSALDVLSQLNKTGDIKMLKYINKGDKGRRAPRP
jgi:hypothetical protein